jgi:hypothetical protein
VVAQSKKPEISARNPPLAGGPLARVRLLSTLAELVSGQQRRPQPECMPVGPLWTHGWAGVASGARALWLAVTHAGPSVPQVHAHEGSCVQLERRAGAPLGSCAFAHKAAYLLVGTFKFI